jgi:methyl-accepting chemotaxis protein
MSTNESRPNGYKTLLRFGQYSLITAALGVGYLSFDQANHRDDMRRNLEVAKVAQTDASASLAMLMRSLPSTLSAEEAHALQNALQRERETLARKSESLKPAVTPLSGYLYPSLSFLLIAALLGMAGIARRLEQGITLTNRRMQGRVEIVEELVAYLRGDQKSIEAVEEALSRLEDLKGEVSFDPRVRRTYSALRSLKELVATLMSDSASLRETLKETQELAVAERAKARDNAQRLKGSLEAAKTKTQSLQDAFSEEMLARIAAANEQVSTLRAKGGHSEQRIAEMEAHLKCVTARLEKSLDLNRKTVKLAKEAQEQVACLATSTGRIGVLAGKIQDVVSRTDMLSLNASIEAVKAGPAGRGFTVVAEEVKSVVEQITEQLASVTQETAEVDGSTERTAAVIGEVVAMTKAIEDLVEQDAGRDLDAKPATTADIEKKVDQDLETALAILRKGREDIREALEGLSRAGREAEALGGERPL